MKPIENLLGQLGRAGSRNIVGHDAEGGDGDGDGNGEGRNADGDQVILLDDAEEPVASSLACGPILRPIHVHT